MSSPKCPGREELLAYHTGDLPEETAVHLIAHVSSCPVCQASLQTLDEAGDTLVSRLRQPAGEDPYAEEPKRGEFLSRLKAMAGACVAAEAGSADEAAGEPVLSGRLGEYQLLEKLGQGGMGAVYKARQTKLDKLVALKVLPKNRTDDERAVARFEREMKAVGRLSHPHIVQALDAREIEGTHLLVMEYVEGLDLSQIVHRLGRLPIADACELIRQAALGLQYAHEHGLVHRDVKPSNLMLSAPYSLGGSGTAMEGAIVKILDLGLAQLRTAEPASEELTATGQVMGTADYMSPEQAMEAHTVDVRADVYSLGCTLYRLLCGRAPFSGPQYDTPMKKAMGHARDTAAPIRQLRPDVPEPLAAIVDHMLAKSPDDRFSTPAEVSAALEPFTSRCDLPRLLEEAEKLAGQPAQPDVSAIATDPHHPSALVGTQPSRPTPAPISPAEKVATSPLSLWERVRVRVRQLPRNSKIALALVPIFLIALGVIIWIRNTKLVVPDESEVRIGPDGSVKVTPPEADLGKGPPPPVVPRQVGEAPAWEPGPAHEVLPGLIPRPAKLPRINRWQVETAVPRGVVRTVDWSPDGKLIACGTTTGHVRICDAATLRLVRLLVGHTGVVNSVAWSPDGKRLASASADRTVRLWGVDGTPGLVFRRHEGSVTCVAWAPSGRRLASAASYEYRVRLWDVDGTPGPVLAHGASSVAWSPDGQWLASGGRGRVQLWQPDGTPGPMLEGGDGCVAWSPDGQWLASAGDDTTVRLWQPDGTPGPVLEGHKYPVNFVAWAPDSGRLASAGSYDNTVRLWEVDGTPGPVLRGHTYLVQSVAWSPDGRQLVSAAEDHTVRLWQADGTPGPVLKAVAAHANSVAWHPDAQRLASGHTDKTVRLWQADGTPGPVLEGHRSQLHSVAWSPDGQWLASGAGGDNTVRLWQADGIPGPVVPHGSGVLCVAWSPDGQWLASGGYGPDIRLWGPDGSPGPVLEAQTTDRATARVNSVAWSPDGRHLASGSYYAIGRIWQADGTPGPALEGDGKPVQSVAWSPDGQWIASSTVNAVRLQKPDGTPGPVLAGCRNAFSLAWSPNGRWLASGLPTGIVSLSDSQGRPGRVLKAHTYNVNSVAFTSDGRWLASSAEDNTIVVHDADTYEPQWAALALDDGKSVTFSPAGEVLHGDSELVEKELVYLIETPSGAVELLAPSEFAKRTAAAAKPADPEKKGQQQNPGAEKPQTNNQPPAEPSEAAEPRRHPEPPPGAGEPEAPEFKPAAAEPPQKDAPADGAGTTERS